MSQNSDPEDSSGMAAMCFSQCVPEPSQAILDARASETRKLQEMNPDARQQLITSLSRYLLFKGLSGDPIDKSKLAKEAFPPNLRDARVTNAALREATDRLRNVFGMDVRRAPPSVLEGKHWPAKYKDRLYVVNQIVDDEQGTHSKALHGCHVDSCVEKGLLMLILAFIYCKGEMKEHVRWLDGKVLYRLLHSLDENVPAEPSHRKQRGSAGTGGGGGGSIVNMERMDDPMSSAGGVDMTPNVDLALDKFVHLDYLIKKKSDNAGVDGGVDDEDAVSYAIGPRSLLVVGLKQIVCFCAQVMDQEPDPTMLQELSQHNADVDVEPMIEE